MADRPLTVVVAPDSFKGSLTSVEVAFALGEGWKRARPTDTVVFVPLADGGEGTLSAIEAAGGWDWQRAAAHDPIGRPIVARWLRRVDGGAAVVELAEASGLSRVAPADRDPIGATTLGTGEVLSAVLDAGIREIALGIGGSATTDGGRGLVEAIGGRVDGDGAGPPGLDLADLDGRLRELSIAVASDVSNPLLGPTGAAATYGPQKGATPAQVEALDRRLATWADALEAASGRHERETPGAGAAGGVGFALLCLQDRFGSFGLRPGVELVMEEAGLDRALAGADVVLTGEGRIDAQTGFGKTALGVARRARAAGVPCVAVGGGVEPDGVTALAAVGATAVPVWEEAVPVDVAMAAGTRPIAACGERLARAWPAMAGAGA
jgi:glycerate kinase